MPELPEVETIRNDLKQKILNKKIIEITIRLPKIVKNKQFEKNIVTQKFKNIHRRGKLIIFEINKDLFMLVHLKITGQLIYKNKNKIIAGGHSEEKLDLNLPNKYSHVYFTFEDESQLFFNDQRQFGYIKLVNKSELNKITDKFGLEILDDKFTLDKFTKLIKNKQRNIKSFLLDQSILAGIGNIYADETLFASKISPLRKTDEIKNSEIENMYENIKTIIAKAISHRGTTFNDYRDADGKKGNFSKFLEVYKKEGELCPICKTKIKKIKVAGRGTRYCEKCQK